MAKEKVVFRRWKTGNKSVIALFPGIKADNSGNCSSYEHIGQHGAADYTHVVSKTTPAYITDDDCRDLYRELEAIGYDIEIIKRAARDT